MSAATVLEMALTARLGLRLELPLRTDNVLAGGIARDTARLYLASWAVADDDVEVAVLQVITELLGNVVRHTDSSYALVVMSHLHDRIRIEVSDFGRPKIDVSHLFFLLGYARDPQLWRPEDVAGAEHTDLVPAMAEAFVRQAERALRPGLLQGYRTTEASSTVLRGRIRETAQLTRRFCLPTPLEIRYDEYTADIPENQLLLAAARQLLTLPALQDSTRRRLLRLAARLTDITLPPRGHNLPTWRANRLNDRYRAALHLADIVLRDNAIDSLPADVTIHGFMVDMWRVFEDFTTTALRTALTARGQHAQPQDPHYLDTAHDILLKPDLVHFSPDGTPLSVLDIKYKAESADGFPNSDLYQMLAYCTALDLPDGHLVYAQGNATSRNHTVHRTGHTDQPAHPRPADTRAPSARADRGPRRDSDKPEPIGVSYIEGRDSGPPTRTARFYAR